MTKRFQSLTIILLAVAIGLLLVGCSKQQTENNTGLDANSGAGEGRPVSLPMQLALGTFSLESTENAVTSEQAAELLPLWKAVKSLSASNNVTTREMDGLYKQIQKAMTPEQMQAIQSLDLTGEKMAEVMKEIGIEPPMIANDELTPEQQATMEARRSSGQRPEGPEGFAPSGGQGGGPGGGMGPEMGGGPPQFFSGDNQGEQSGQNQPRGGLNSAFYDAVIKLLEEKTQ